MIVINRLCRSLSTTLRYSLSLFIIVAVASCGGGKEPDVKQIGTPTVINLTTEDNTPTITGSFDSSDISTSFTVTVGNIIYTLNDADLSSTGNIWSLTIPTSNKLVLGTYEVVATASDNAGNSSTDSSTNELIIHEAPILIKSLNDTGITLGGNYPSGNNSSCIGESVSQQDCNHGRDVTHNDDSDGHAGFSFTKLDNEGNSLPANAASWSCIRDNVTKLIWEHKKNSGLHNKDDLYTWLKTKKGRVGKADGGNICFGYNIDNAESYCNSHAYAARVSEAKLCGINNWRVPTVIELRSIVDQSKYSPPIDTDYFSNTGNNRSYWTSLLGAQYSGTAWLVRFDSAGQTSTSGYSGHAKVRLVSNEQ